MKIIPGILAKNKKELEKQLEAVKWAKKIHLDIIDGKFSPNKTIQKIPVLKQKYGVHLMVVKPEKYLKRVTDAEEIIIPAKKASIALIKKIQQNKIKVGIAIEPETNPDKYKKMIKQADIVQIMTVHSGYYGQKFIKKAVDKIKKIRKIKSSVIIGIDGGVNIKTIKYTKKADYAIATSAVTLAKNPLKSYKELMK